MRKKEFEENAMKLADFFKVFSDPSRIRILYQLFETECAVSELAEILGMSQSATSHQLRILKENRLVKVRRDGKSMLYSLSDSHVVNVIEQGIEHVTE